MLLWQGRNLWLLSNKGQIGDWWKGHSPALVASWPASAQHLVLSDSAFAFWVPHPRCAAALELEACYESHYLPPKTPPYPLLTREAALYTAARPALRPWRRAQHLGASSQTSLVPHPVVLILPLQPGAQELSSPRSRFSPERRRSSPSFVCAREPSWGGGRRGEVAVYLSPPPLPGPLEVQRRRRRRDPESRCEEPLDAQVPAARRERARGGEGGDRESGGPILPPSRLGLTAPLPPRRLQRSAPRRREGRRARINSGGGSASSGGAGSAGRVRRPVLPARPQDFAMGWGPRGLRAASQGQRRRRPHWD